MTCPAPQARPDPRHQPTASDPAAAVPYLQVVAALSSRTDDLRALLLPEWFVVILAFLADLGAYGGGARGRD